MKPVKCPRYLGSLTDSRKFRYRRESERQIKRITSFTSSLPAFGYRVRLRKIGTFQHDLSESYSRVLRPSQGFWGFREKGCLFSGIWGEGSFIFRDMGRNWGFREQGAEENHFRELGRKVNFLSGSREQRPLPGEASVL